MYRLVHCHCIHTKANKLDDLTEIFNNLKTWSSPEVQGFNTETNKWEYIYS